MSWQCVNRAKDKAKKKKKKSGDAKVKDTELWKTPSPGLHRENLCKVHRSERGE